LGAFYFRLIGNTLDIYNYLEPLLMDWRKIRLKKSDGKNIITHIDEIIDGFLINNYYFDLQLPRIPSRFILEKLGKLSSRKSALEDFINFEFNVSSNDSEIKTNKKKKKIFFLRIIYADDSSAINFLT
jgi:pre-mRNA-splicing factor 38A